jgi:hypothetical protein
VDVEGEMSLPADEQLADVDEVEAVAGESSEEEAKDTAGPFAEAPDLADLEIEE